MCACAERRGRPRGVQHRLWFLVPRIHSGRRRSCGGGTYTGSHSVAASIVDCAVVTCQCATSIPPHCSIRWATSTDDNLRSYGSRLSDGTVPTGGSPNPHILLSARMACLSASTLPPRDCGLLGRMTRLAAAVCMSGTRISGWQAAARMKLLLYLSLVPADISSKVKLCSTLPEGHQVEVLRCERTGVNAEMTGHG